MNIFTFTNDGDCDKAGCRVPSIDIDSQGSLIIHYTSSGSPEVWEYDDQLDLDKWYEIEIKQYAKDYTVTRTLLYVDGLKYKDDTPLPFFNT